MNNLPTCFYECCPDCGEENRFRTKNHYTANQNLIWKVCNECGKVIKPCAICDGDTCDCSKCPLGADRDVWIMEADTNAGMIDFGRQFGLSEYIISVEAQCVKDGKDVPSDKDLVKGWLDSLGLVDGKFYRISDSNSSYRVYPISFATIMEVDHPLGKMIVDIGDTDVKCDYLVFNEVCDEKA